MLRCLFSGKFFLYAAIYADNRKTIPMRMSLFHGGNDQNDFIWKHLIQSVNEEKTLDFLQNT